MTFPSRPARVLFILSVFASALPALTGCALLPSEVKAWLTGFPEDPGANPKSQEEYFVYDYPVNPEPEPAPQPTPHWSEQSWIDGAPVHTPEQPKPEKKEPYLRATPLGYERVVFKGNPEERISKLEVEVSSLRQRVDAMLPALRALVDARGGRLPEADPQQGKVAVPQGGPPQTLTSWPQSPPQSRASVGGAAASDTFAENIRFGEHGNKTRIVVDMNRPAAYTYELSNDQGYLAIVLPDAGWRGAVRGTLNNSPLFSGYTVQQVPGKGSRLVLQLRKPVNVLFADQLDPNNTYRNHRIFIDVAGL
ncbi:MAG: hypothetical protein EOM26_06960 [Alphaproteobacteria bacterium]|nr:hypothetical protein [Alphaproteobacteria bacterium]